MKVDISFPFALMLAVVLLFDYSGVAAISLAAAALHEAGHLAAMAACHRQPRQITFKLSGVYITQNSGTHSAASDCIVSAAGPLANLLCAAALFAAGAGDAAIVIGCSMLIMGCFNLLPVYGLDGGDLLHAALCARLSPTVADRVLWVVSIVTAALVTLLGVLLFIVGGNGWLMAIGVYIMCFSLFPRSRV